MLLILAGFTIGAIGTLIGAGGGVILVPLLLYIYPEAAPTWVGGISMGMIALNATSGSISYFLKKTIHLRAAGVFVVASLPGSILGVALEHAVDRQMFERIFGGAMIALAAFLILRKKRAEPRVTATTKLSRAFYVNGSLISFAIGFIASFLSIGGGVIHVPLLTQVLGFPVHLATGTSHLILGCTAWIASATHLWHGDISLTDPVLWQVGLSAAVGAQLGARLSPKVPGLVILRILAVALIAVGLRLLLRPH